MIAPVDLARWEPLIREAIESGRTSECGGCEFLRGRTRGRGMLMRITDSGGDSVVVKACRQRDLKERLQGLSGLSMAHREWRAHEHVVRSGIRAPRLLQFLRLNLNSGERFEAIVMEDLGPTCNGMVHLKELIAQGDEDAVESFESRVVGLTERLLAAKVVDVDHQFRNIVVGQDREPMRVDFECARVFRGAKPPASSHGAMLGWLIVSHAFTCQPETSRTERFADHLRQCLRPPEAVLEVAKERVNRTLEHQRLANGIDSRVRLEW
ncbi:MAG: hypothetical protein IT430_07850 [Phycisphaerales bacterium]|nr:hypothetical protein [Phycisphaerales bacterium]